MLLGRIRSWRTTALSSAAALLCTVGMDVLVLAQRPVGTIFPERTSIRTRLPEQLPRYQIPTALMPSTVSRPIDDLTPHPLALDGAIRTSMRNLDVIRVLGGVSATNSGRTIYDVALSHTSIDQEQAVFDPLLSVTNTWSLTENPVAVLNNPNPVLATDVLFLGSRRQAFQTTTQLTKRDLTGGQWTAGFSAIPSNSDPSSTLDPFTSHNSFISFSQPILQGAGIEYNLAPIVIAEINTERSYFQFKDTMQEHVRGIIEAYWQLVSARTDLWARKQQVEQLEETVRRVEARVRQAIDNRADLAQAQLALANIRSSVVTAQGAVLLREQALRNMIGISPSDGTVFIPTTPPVNEKYAPDWSQMLELAEQRRPDIVELKLILEADQQQRLIAQNNARPSLNAVARYDWNGQYGSTRFGTRTTQAGQFTDWTIGVNFSVPLGLRQSRAALRRQDLVIARDQLNLKQGLYAATHSLATAVRTIDQQYEQYLALREARRAARVNLDAQLLRWQTQQAILINVLQAISEWGNTVSAEANALTQYNALLASLERQTGTILETHGVYFVQESQQAIGPHCLLGEQRCYPRSTRPTENIDAYQDSDEPAEKSFELTPPTNLGAPAKQVPYRDIKLPTLEEIMRQQRSKHQPPQP